LNKGVHDLNDTEVEESNTEILLTCLLCEINSFEYKQK